MEGYRLAVSRGVAWLDSQVPNWWQKVDLDKFNCQDARYCPLHYAFKSDLHSGPDAYFFGRSIWRAEYPQLSGFEFGFSDGGHNPYWLETIRGRRALQDYPGPLGYNATVYPSSYR